MTHAFVTNCLVRLCLYINLVFGSTSLIYISYDQVIEDLCIVEMKLFSFITSILWYWLIMNWITWQEDVALMKVIGFDAYRFSISWSRLLPRKIELKYTFNFLKNSQKV